MPCAANARAYKIHPSITSKARLVVHSPAGLLFLELLRRAILAHAKDVEQDKQGEREDRRAEQHANRQRQHPGQNDIPERRRLQSERFAAIGPATPDESTCVVLTGRPNQSASPIVPIATSSADAPCP